MAFCAIRGWTCRRLGRLPRKSKDSTAADAQRRDYQPRYDEGANRTAARRRSAPPFLAPVSDLPASSSAGRDLAAGCTCARVRSTR